MELSFRGGAEELVASKYPEWLQRGFHIITPNRQILTAPSEQYEECFKYVGHLESIYFDLSRRVFVSARRGRDLLVPNFLESLLYRGKY